MRFIIIICCIFAFSNIGLAAALPITSSFGWRNHPVTGEWKFHSGLDLGYDYGTEIPVLFAGQITLSGDCNDGYGNQILVYHPAINAYTRYAHCSKVYVSAGQEVYAGQIIACVGSTGNSTGPHLHLEYIVYTQNGLYEYADPIALWQ